MNNSIASRIYLLLIFGLSFFQSYSQEIKPKREFRGAWVATVVNIDFPTVPGLRQEQLTGEWTSNLDYLKEAGMNAVFVQIRPTGDAFYKSKLAPWSKYLTGKTGKAPVEDYDPLQMMIEEAHDRNMEFHAWLNPYRAAMDTLVDQLGNKHPYHAHPEWFVIYGGKLYFNQAIPEVRNYITEVVTEIVMNYDVDGIHFDDYFYPYPAAGELYPDKEEFTKYGFGYSNIDDWRRSNVNALVSQVGTMIKTIAPHVKFGVSPFGVWRNNNVDPNGSPTRASVSSYDNLYADILLWLEKGWIDYVAPQLYWHVGFEVADYERLIDWWKEHTHGKQLYIGHAIYKVGTNPDPAWRNSNQIPLQVSLNRMVDNVDGSIFYNTNSLKKNLLGVSDSLRMHYFKNMALWPEMQYLNLDEPPIPKLSKIKAKKGKLLMKASISEDAHYLVVYRFESRKPGDYNNPENLFRIIRLEGKKSVLIEDDPQKGKSYTYAVSAANRQHTESLLSEWRAVEVGNKKIKRIK